MESPFFLNDYNLLIVSKGGKNSDSVFQTSNASVLLDWCHWEMKISHPSMKMRWANFLQRLYPNPTKTSCHSKAYFQETSTQSSTMFKMLKAACPTEKYKQSLISLSRK